MSQWKRRASEKTTDQLQHWISKLDERIDANPDSTKNLVVKKDFLLKEIENRK